MDKRLRELERRAATGDQQALTRLERLRRSLSPTLSPCIALVSRFITGLDVDTTKIRVVVEGLEGKEPQASPLVRSDVNPTIEMGVEEDTWSYDFKWLTTETYRNTKPRGVVSYYARRVLADWRAKGYSATDRRWLDTRPLPLPDTFMV